MATNGIHTNIASTALDLLSSLPSELKFAIFEYLTVKEICRVRVLSRHFYTLINDEQNNILTSKLAKQLARITYDYNSLCTPSTNIFKAVRGYRIHYGGVHGRKIGEHIANKLLRAWCSQYKATDGARTPPLVSFAEQLMHLAPVIFVPRHKRPDPDLSIESFTPALTKLSMDLGMPELTTDIHLLPHLIQSSMPGWFLGVTPEGSIDMGECHLGDGSMNTFLPEALCLELKAPAIPDGWYAWKYYIKTPSLGRLAMDIQHKRSGIMTLFERAALLEEMYLW